jgi:hypothetical protein
MREATVKPINKSECAICLITDNQIEYHKFLCGCIVNAHKKCLQQWFNTSNKLCVYCRKPTRQQEKSFTPSAPSPLVSLRTYTSDPEQHMQIRLPPQHHHRPLQDSPPQFSRNEERTLSVSSISIESNSDRRKTNILDSATKKNIVYACVKIMIAIVISIVLIIVL